jgi:hypothetical protein
MMIGPLLTGCPTNVAAVAGLRDHESPQLKRNALGPDARRSVERSRGLAPRAGRGDSERRPGNGQPERRASAQAVLHLRRSDCQQIRAHPSVRNASWMSALFVPHPQTAKLTEPGK